ncbi:MAG: UvrB/UvrC motif-containing protein [Planctomycetota bacterium]
MGKKRPDHLDDYLSEWDFDPQSLNVRMIKGHDGRDLLQMRVDMGILQLEVSGRPDKASVHGFESCVEWLQLRKDNEPLDEAGCADVDREFMQFYHRRICWLHLQYYHRAVMDADHTLRLMDLSSETSPDEEWTASHEQYRPFVLFHRTQAQALGYLEDEAPEDAISAINEGLETMRSFFAKHEAEEHFEEDDLVQRLTEMRESMRSQYDVGKTLHEQLAAAVEEEQYELAARLRDELTRRETT